MLERYQGRVLRKARLGEGPIVLERHKACWTSRQHQSKCVQVSGSKFDYRGAAVLLELVN
jgi:hypothetical protein